MRAVFFYAPLFAISIHTSYASRTSQSPISRVVELLQGLSTKIEDEGKAEESLYEKFVCWAQSNVAAKTKSNEAANSRIESLQRYIADIDAGRVEFTSERTDLEQELAQLNQDLETAAALRAKENADFLSAQSEMQQGITALTEAIRILGEATGGARSSLMALKGKARSGFAARVAEAKSLAHAADLGDRFLSKGDARFLRRLLTGDFPVKDWKKLNREATFKKTYEARSGDIQDVLAKLLETFNQNLAEAQSKEQQAQTNYDTLAASKGAQKTDAENALLLLEEEGGASGLSKADAQAEVTDLQTQVTDDTRYIGDVNTALETKKSEWRTRSELRTQELAAISKAINILHNDDSRDLFKKSFASQGYLFLQVQAASKDQIRTKVINQLRKVTAASGDKRLLALVSAATGAHFDRVIQAIDSMVATLQNKESQELAQKQQCESDRSSDTQAAAVASRTIDDHTDAQTRLESEIKELQDQIDENNKEIAKITEELAEAARLRADAKKAYESARQDDVDAKALLVQAQQVLTQFYADNGLVLLSRGQKQGQAPVSAAGEAPPPPPETWEAPYGGKTIESGGIVSILAMIEEDLQSDIDDADAAETTAIQEYNTMKTTQEGTRSGLETTNGQLQGTIAGKETEIQTEESNKGLQKQELDRLITKLKDAQPGCDFVSVNFAVRSQNRQTEINGLNQAKAILEEVNVGGSLVQKPRALLAVHRS